MGIMNDVKDTTRKVANTVVDKTEDLVGMTKSPKELANRVIEHLTHREYKEIASMLSAEARKYLDKTGLGDSKLAKEKLDDFDKAAKDIAIDLKNHNYKEVTEQLEKLEKTLPEKATESYPILGSVKNILRSIIDACKKHVKDDVEPEFKDILKTLESSFDKFTNK